MRNCSKPNNDKRRACMAKKYVLVKVECDKHKNGANFFWPAAIQLILFAAKSFFEDYFK